MSCLSIRRMNRHQSNCLNRSSDTVGRLIASVCRTLKKQIEF